MANRVEVGARRALIERLERCSGTNLCVPAASLAELQRLPPARFPSPERASPNGSKNGGRVAHRRRAQKRGRRRYKAQLAKESVEHGRREAQDYVRPFAGPPFLAFWIDPPSTSAQNC